VLHHWSRTQPCVAQSTCEAELVAANAGACEARMLQNLMQEIGLQVHMELRTDSNSARQTVMKRGSGRMKHLDVKRLWLQQELREGRISIERVPTATNEADLFTKNMPQARLRILLDLIKLGKNSEART
jgi:hypothetical protein